MKTLSGSFKRLSAVQLSLLALMMALEIVVGRISIGPNWLQVQFTFIVIAIIAAWFGPAWGAAVAFIADFIGTLFSGFGYYPGFALSAILTMTIFAVSFYGRNRLSWIRIIVTVFLQLMLVNAILNTTWVVLMGYVPLDANVILIRVLKQFVAWPIEVIVIYFVLNNQAIRSLRDRILTDAN
jgi:ECF transporter S component (folate family)